MTPLERQTAELQAEYPGTVVNPLSTGGHLVEILNFHLPPGWNQTCVTLLFLAPPGYPAAQPDCFWVEPREPVPVRLEGGGTPQNTNDTNLIPGLDQPRGTWFSWHLQHWDPNRDTLLRYVRVILQRLNPAR